MDPAESNYIFIPPKTSNIGHPNCLTTNTFYRRIIITIVQAHIQYKRTGILRDNKSGWPPYH